MKIYTDWSGEITKPIKPNFETISAIFLALPAGHH
jgi:hypothetical protein